MPQVVGTVALQFTANTAQFHQETGKVNKTLGETSKNFGGAQRAASNFAAKGIAEAIPALQGFEHQIGSLLTKVANAQGLLGTLGAAGLIAGGILGGIRLGNLISDFIDLGSSLEDYEKKMKAAGEEQDKFLAKLIKAGDTTRSVRADLAKSRADLAQSAAELGGDLFGAAAGKHQQAVLDIEAGEEQIRRSIVATTERGAAQEALITANKQAHLNRRLAADNRYWAEQDKIASDALAKSTADFAKANNAELDALEKRRQLRKEIEARATTVVEAGLITDPGARAEAVKKDFVARAEAFAVLIQKGRAWRDVQNDVFATEQEFIKEGLPGFAQAVLDTGESFKKVGVDTDSLTQATENWRKGLNEIPASVDKADPAIKALIERFGQMQQKAMDAAAAIQFLNSVVTPGVAPQPQVLAPQGGQLVGQWQGAFEP
jgi:hypothetical protein